MNILDLDDASLYSICRQSNFYELCKWYQTNSRFRAVCSDLVRAEALIYAHALIYQAGQARTIELDYDPEIEERIGSVSVYGSLYINDIDTYIKEIDVINYHSFFTIDIRSPLAGEELELLKEKKRKELMSSFFPISFTTLDVNKDIEDMYSAYHGGAILYLEDVISYISQKSYENMSIRQAGESLAKILMKTPPHFENVPWVEETVALLRPYLGKFYGRKDKL